jgi:hypothetical protein
MATDQCHHIVLGRRELKVLSLEAKLTRRSQQLTL